MIDHLKNPGYLNLQTHNAPLTSHHHNIINTALSDHTLVHSLSDWDATIIAADLTRQFYTKNATGKIILISTSSEWINQLNDYLTRIIPSDAVIHLTGTKDIRKRDVYWSEKRVFLASPSIIFNDIKSGKCLVWHIRHFVLHEAHKAKGDHSYCRIVSHLNDMNYKDYKILAISNECTKNFKTVKTKLKLRHIISWAKNGISETAAPSESTPQARCPTTALYQIPETQQNVTINGSNHAHKADCQDVLPRRLFASGSKSDSRTVNIRNSISEEEYRQSSSRQYHERELIPKRKEYWAMSTATFKNIKRPDEKEISLTRWLQSHKTSHNCNSIKPSKDSQILAELLQFNDTLKLRMSSSNQNPSVDVEPEKEPTGIVAETKLSSSRTTETPFSDNWLPSTSGLQIWAAPSALIAQSKSPTNTVSYMEKKLPITAAEASFKNIKTTDKKDLTRRLQSQKTSQNCSFIKPSKDSQSLAEILQYIDTLRQSVLLPSNQKPSSEPDKKPTVIVTQSNQSSPKTKKARYDNNQATSTSTLQKHASLNVSVTNSIKSPSNASSYVGKVLPMTVVTEGSSKATETSFSDNQQPSTSRLEENVLSKASVTNSNIEPCTKTVRDVEPQVAAAPIVEDCTSHRSPSLSIKKRKRKQENDISAAKRNRDNRDYPKIEQICYLLDNLSNVTNKPYYICTNDNSECSILQELRKPLVVESLKHLQIPDTSIGEYGVETTLRMQTSIGITEKQATTSNTKLTDGSSIDTNMNSINQSDKKINELSNNNVNKSTNFDLVDMEMSNYIDKLLAELNEYHTEKTKDTEFIEEDMTSNIPTEQSISGPASTSPGRPQEEDNSPEQSNIVERPLSTLKSSDRPQIEDNFPKQSNNVKRPCSPLMSSE